LRADDEFPESRLLRAAASGEHLELVGLASCLRALGLDEHATYEATDRSGTRCVGHAEMERIFLAQDLVVDLGKASIRARDGRAIDGSRLACALLARLALARGAVVDAETLFCEVWEGKAYHPLRHRNTVHVGITRLRRMLRDVLPDREVVGTMEHGWRLADGVAVCVVRLLPE
jgi:DNA-binding response OmpR family regulator